MSQKNKDYRVAVSYVPCDMQPGKEAEPYIKIYSQTETILQEYWEVIEMLVKELLDRLTLTGVEAHSIIESFLKKHQGQNPSVI